VQVHQSITATAVQQAQRSTAAAFEQFMDRCLHSQWEEVSNAGGAAWRSRSAAAVRSERTSFVVDSAASCRVAGCLQGRVYGLMVASRGEGWRCAGANDAAASMAAFYCMTCARFDFLYLLPIPRPAGITWLSLEGPGPVRRQWSSAYAAQEKRALLESVAPYSLATSAAGVGGRTPGLSPGGYLSPYSRTPSAFGGTPGAAGAGNAYRGTPLPLGGRTPGGLAGTPLTASGLQLRGRAAKYADVACKINQAEASKQTYAAVKDFAAACADEANGRCTPTVPAHAWGLGGWTGKDSAGTRPARRQYRGIW
jgi:hypothetical protein